MLTVQTHFPLRSGRCVGLSLAALICVGLGVAAADGGDAAIGCDWVGAAPGNLFFPGERLRFEVIAPGPAGTCGKISWTVRDDQARPRARGKVAGLTFVRPPAAAEGAAGISRHTVEIKPALPLGHYRVELTVRAAQRTQSVQRSFAIVPRPREGRHPESPFGLDFHPFRLGVIARRLGVRWARIELSPSNAHPTPERWVWEAYDAGLEEIEKQGLQPLGTLDYVSEWASMADPDVKGWERMTSPPDPVVWREFVRRVVARYKGRIRFYEFWNEGTLGGGWWRGSAQPFRDTAAITAAEIHQGDPQAKILVGSSTASTDLLRVAIWDTPVDQLVDGYSVHRYINDIPEGAFLADTDDLVRNGRARGKRHFWDTEMGWAARPANYNEWNDRSAAMELTPQAQADYLVRSYVLSLAAGVERYFWYSLHEGPGVLGGLGVFSDSNDVFYPECAAAAYATMASLLEDTRFVAEILPGRQPFGFVFSRPRQGEARESVAVLWTTRGRGWLHLAEPPPGLRAIQWNGEAVRLRPTAFAVPLSGSPVYLTGPMAPEQLLAAVRQAQINGLPPATVAHREQFAARRGSPRVDGDLAEWAGLGAVFFSLRSAERLEPATSRAADWTPETFSAECAFLWDETALYFGARVRDPSHFQEWARSREYRRGASWYARRKPLAYYLLRGDGVRLLFDSGSPPRDGERPRDDPSFDYGGLRRTCDYLYGLALTVDGPVLYRFRSPRIPWGWDISDNPDRGYGPVQASTVAIQRDDARRQTVYETAIPWEELRFPESGDGQRPPVGRSFRFNVVISDGDASVGGQRWRLNLSRGRQEGRLVRPEIAPYWLATAPPAVTMALMP